MLIAALKKHVAGLEAEAKAELAGTMEPGQTNRPKIDGSPVGTVAYTLGSERIIITDDDAFLAWVDKHHPTEVEVTVRPRASFVASLKIVGDNVRDGDLSIPDGVAVRQDDPYISVRPGKDAGPVLWAAVRADVAQLLGGAE